MPVQEDLEEGTDELSGCCGRLLATNHECEHTLCDRVKEAYRVGGLLIELEKCPHPGGGAQFYASPHSKPSSPGLHPLWCFGLHLWGM